MVKCQMSNVNLIFYSFSAIVFEVIKIKVRYMPKKCEICEKTSTMERSRKKLMSRYNPTPKRRKRPNLQKTNIPESATNKRFKNFLGKKVLACTKCIKTLGKEER
jgi:ribosomal protein L28